MSEVNKHEYSQMRKELNKAHLEIIQKMEYRGARESDVVGWLADFVENNFVKKDNYLELQQENHYLKHKIEGLQVEKRILLRAANDNVEKLESENEELKARVGKLIGVLKECAEFNNVDDVNGIAGEIAYKALKEDGHDSIL